jgi:hypothetical protein
MDINNYKNKNKNIIEQFDGVRKNNSRIIFGLLLTFIIIDSIITPS